MKFRGSFDKIKTFRVMDENSNIVNFDGLEKLIEKEKLLKIFDTMLTINEADKVFQAAQR